MSEANGSPNPTAQHLIDRIEKAFAYIAIMEKCVFFLHITQQSVEGSEADEDYDDDLQAGVLGLYDETRRFMVRHGGMSEERS